MLRNSTSLTNQYITDILINQRGFKKL